MKSLGRSTGLLCLGIFGLIIAGFGSSLIVSAIFSCQADRYLNSWQFAGRPPEATTWAAANRAIERAIDWHPGQDAALYTSLARVLDWKHFSLPVGDPRARESRRASLAAYRRATALRPNWPYTWSELALIKTRLGESDGEMIKAMQNALQNGPWRPSVLHRVIELGLYSWYRLSYKGRALTLYAVGQAIRLEGKHASQAWKTVERYYLRAQVCVALKDDIEWLGERCAG